MNKSDYDWGGFRSWIHSVAVVTFDLELGQVIENTFPECKTLDELDQLSEQDRTNICYLAFPDSNSGIMGDIQFHFRIRRTAGHNVGPPAAAAALANFNARCLPPLQLDQNFLFGFAYFRQVKDSSIRRGYYQKSVILLTYLPLVSFFSQISAIVAKKFFENGDLPLEIFCHDVDRWPAPTPGHHLTLPMLGSLIELHIPALSSRHTDNSNETVTVSGGGVSVPNLPDLYPTLLPLLEHLHCLWELVLTAEPVVVLAPSPFQCSSTVQALTTIIQPLRYVADYRPFYTIHDADLKEMTTSNSSALPSILLGVTNPFFNKALEHWPNLVRLAEPSSLSALKSPSKTKRSSSTKFKSETKPGVFTQSKPHLEKDREIVKRILKGVQLRRPAEVQTALLRRYFLELTQTFLIPLERYLAGLMPLARSISPYRAPPKVKPFNADEFIRSLEQSGPQLTSRTKGDWAALYRRFLKSPNFVGWFNARHAEVSSKLSLLHLECLSEAKIEIWMEGKAEVELVDMVLRIRGKLTEGDRTGLPISDIVKERLETHVRKIVSTLPEDLQAVIESKS
ncbi:protein DENND6A [Eurytemora carolleeae]|uniref:protein DENND6A n=1 Tax=Eurytemora carolleeae TaxID=1294199 RepID=UPI000C78D1E8|nr:protein DENND6A [Eurytemora carolleeae]|eukprot:XP_023322220.1 protein DENND6A-like [Eurytemora affinis]